MMKHLIPLALAALATLPASAKTLVNVDVDGVAVQGYDVVAFFSEGKAVAGDPAIRSVHDGAIYRFASEENKAAFQKEPAKYVPVFGGYCALGVAYDGLYPVMIETWQVLDGRLVLNKNPDIRAKFDKDRGGYMKKAEANWPGLIEKNGR